MSSYMKKTVVGITVLFFVATPGYAGDREESAEAYVSRMLAARGQEREAESLREARERDRYSAEWLQRARAREMAKLVDEVLADADLRSSLAGSRTSLSLDTVAADPRGLVTAGEFVSLGAFQDEPAAADAAGNEGGLAQKSDKSGTNPINFQFELRFYNEYQYLNTAGDGWQNITTTEFRAPFADGKWSLRVKARAQFLEADLDGDGSDDVDESGLGDTDIRFLTVPILDVEKKMAFAVAMEFFLDTASDDALGSGATSLGPQVFLVLFQPFGLPLDLFAPGYQHVFSVDGDDVHRSLIDLFVLKTWDNKRLWFLGDPQIIIDYENDTEFLLLDLEFGTMLGKAGHSAYVRPSFGVGNDRPYDASIEVGYKIVW